MDEPLSTHDRIVVERLITEIGGRLTGAADIWTVVCLGQVADPHAFVQRYADILRSLIVSLDTIFPTGNGKPLVTRLLQDCDVLNHSFLDLAGFRAMPPDRLQRDCENVRDVHHRMTRTLTDLGDALGLQLAELRSRRTQQEKYIDGILDRLFDLFQDARANQPPPIASSAATRQP